MFFVVNSHRHTVEEQMLRTRIASLPIIRNFVSVSVEESPANVVPISDSVYPIAVAKNEGYLLRKWRSFEDWFSPLRGVSTLSWFLGILFTVLVLSKYLSPLVATFAMVPVVAPIASLVLLILGEFEAAKLQTMLVDNAGVVGTTLGAVMLALFVQNCVKSTVLVQSMRTEHSEYRANAIAGLLAPLATAFLWWNIIQVGYFELAFKSFGVGLVFIFAGPELAKVTSLNLEILGQLAKVMRIPMAIIAGLHLCLVYISYTWVYHFLEKVLKFALRNDLWLGLGRAVWGTLKTLGSRVLNFARNHPLTTAWIVVAPTSILLAAFLSTAFLWPVAVLTVVTFILIDSSKDN